MDLTIFAGTTGFNKSKYLEAFTERHLKKAGYPTDLHSDDSRRYIHYIKFEDELISQDKQASDIASFLDKPSTTAKNETIEDTFTAIANQIKATTEHIFLDIHLSYYKRSTFIPPINFSNFHQLVSQEIPIKVITLIDDAFVIWQTLKEKEEDFPNTDLRLREILSWRSVEMLQAETVAINYTTVYRPTPVLNYLFAIRHPPETLDNIVFRPRPKCAYLSYPITRTRTRPDCVSNINKFRKEVFKIVFRQNWSLFDPVTIDELALKYALDSTEADTVSLKREMRWPIDKENQFIKEPNYPIELPRTQITEVLSKDAEDINNNIRSRDFKLIDLSKFTIAYRPYYVGESKGVQQEMNYTIGLGRRVIAYDPPEDIISESPHPFDNLSAVRDDLDKFKTLIRGQIKKEGSKKANTT